MKQSTADISVQADKEKAADLQLFSADKPKISDSVRNSNLAAIRTMIDEYKFNCETYF